MVWSGVLGPVGIGTTRVARLAALLALVLVGSLAVALGQAPAAHADTAPVSPPVVPTVSSDPLPTVQINGIVWDQVIVGNRVYVTGEFTSARPAGSPLGTNETPRSNILAYDLTTGALITSWAPSLNALGRAIVASPDGSRIYVGGNFTSVSGVTRYRLVALDATTGAVITQFAPVFNARVGALAVSGGTIYAGGIFSTVSGAARTRLVALNGTTGAVLAWNPPANAEPLALTAPAGSGKVVIGGKFTSLNGSTTWYGLGAVDATTGVSVPWAATSTVKNAGNNAAIYSLTTDGTNVYGTGYTFGSGGNLESTFTARASDGAMVNVSGCRGDTYDSAAIGGVLYSVGHAHDCSSIGGHPQSNPWTYQRATAQTTGASPLGRTNNGGQFPGQAAPELLHWLPVLQAGTYSGSDQAAWNVTGNADYVLLGGEFPRVNNVAQQGLVRFATSAIAPDKQGPQGAADMTPTFTSNATGTIELSWKAAWDTDNKRLTYEVLRNGTVAGTLAFDSNWWTLPTISWTDLNPGSGDVSYRIRAKDAFGNAATGPAANVTVPAATSPAGNYTSTVQADQPSQWWRFGETSGSTAYDSGGGQATDLTLGALAGRSTGAITGDPNGATSFNSLISAPAYPTSSTALRPMQTFTLEAWFKTTSTSGGKIIGFGNSRNGDSSSTDRQVWLTNDGKAVFAVNNGTPTTVVSPTGGLNNGQWHHVAATLGSDGMKLYVDGSQVAAAAGVTTSSLFNGFWRIGGDAISSNWPNRPTSTTFGGTVDEVAVYPAALTAAQIANHRTVGGGGTPNAAPTASFTSTTSGLGVSVDGSASADADGTVAGHAWNWGDGSTSSGATASHTYAAAGSYTVTLTVTDDDGATGTAVKAVAVAENQAPTASFTATPSGLTGSFDASASADADGAVAGYAWDFGDGTTGAGRTTTRTYAAAGTYQVTLTVTDNAGKTGSVTKPITVAVVGAGDTAAEDAFGRTVASGWGTADTGGAWTTGGTGTASSVDGGAGLASVPAGRTASARLSAVSGQDTDLTYQVGVDQDLATGGVYLYGVPRATAGGEYRVKVRVQPAGVTSSIVKVVGGTETALTSTVLVSGVSYATGDRLQVRVQTSGSSPTTIRYRVWKVGTTEPTTWQQTVTDSTAGLQEAGSVGVLTYQSSSPTAVVVRYDNLKAARL